jgi:hypothetical protein
VKNKFWVIFLLSRLFAQNGNDILAAGNPPLSQRMVDGEIGVLEMFLEVKFTDDQRVRLRQLWVEVWNKGDRKGIQIVLDDAKYVGHDDDLRAVRDSNQAAYVEEMRKDPRDPRNAVLLEAYNAAHPDRGEIMKARGWGQLVGEWKRQDAILPTRERYTGRLQGISATDSLILNIFSDGRFHHLWAHSNCGSGNTCCNEYSTTADGVVSVETTKLLLEATSGNELFKAPCTPQANLFQTLQQRRNVLSWSLRRDPATGSPQLCLEKRPFNPQWGQPSGVVCYLKQR